MGLQSWRVGGGEEAGLAGSVSGCDVWQIQYDVLDDDVAVLVEGVAEVVVGPVVEKVGILEGGDHTRGRGGGGVPDGDDRRLGRLGRDRAVNVGADLQSETNRIEGPVPGGNTEGEEGRN